LNFIPHRFRFTFPAGLVIIDYMKKWIIPIVILVVVAVALSVVLRRGGKTCNVLLISVDTLRPDHLGCYGYEPIETGNIDGIAEDGFLFTQAHACVPLTLPSHTSLLTGMSPISTGVRDNGAFVLPGNFVTLAEALKAEGYSTAAFVSTFVLDSRFGLDQGFDIYDDRMETSASATGFYFPERTAAHVNKPALDWLSKAEEPFFAFVHYFDPHYPYTPPDGYDSMFATGSDDDLVGAIGAYDGEIAFADREVDVLLRFLERSGLDDETLVVVTADHGEGLMDHGHLKHGIHVYEEAVRVPLLFRLPGGTEGGKILAEPVELLDLMPTILDLAGVEAGDDLQGRNLAGALRGTDRLDPGRAVYLHRRHYDPQTIGRIRVAGEKFGIRVGPWKYIEGEEGDSPELFHLIDDPQERVNLADSRPDVAEDLASRIAAWKAAHARGGFEQPELSPEDRERLEALGYLN
jgi:arylsulfatase A-like enzyme